MLGPSNILSQFYVNLIAKVVCNREKSDWLSKYIVIFYVSKTDTFILIGGNRIHVFNWQNMNDRTP